MGSSKRSADGANVDCNGKVGFGAKLIAFALCCGETTNHQPHTKDKHTKSTESSAQCVTGAPGGISLSFPMSPRLYATTSLPVVFPCHSISNPFECPHSQHSPIWS